MIGEEYDRVRSALFSSTSGSGGGLFVQPNFTALLPQFPEVSYDTLVSIFAQDCVSRVKVAHAVHRRYESEHPKPNRHDTTRCKFRD